MTVTSEIVVFAKADGALQYLAAKNMAPAAGDTKLGLVALPAGYQTAMWDWNATKRQMVESAAKVEAMLIAAINDERETRQMAAMTTGGAKKAVYAMQQAEVLAWAGLGAVGATTTQLVAAFNLVTDAALAVDGQVGPMTVRVLSSFIAKRGKVGESRLLALLNAFQGTRYAELAEGRSANRAFIYGWLARIMPVALLALTLSACATTPATICTGSDLRRTAYTATIAAADAWTASGRPVPSEVMLARMGAVAALGLLNGRCPAVTK